MQKNIVVPVDFSPCSINALDYALSIAGLFQLGIRVVHVHKTEVLVDAMPVGAPQYISQPIPEHIRSQMADLRADYASKYDKIDFIIKEGVLHDVLREAQEVFHAKLIVMGTEGEQNIADRFFGTNASSVVAKHKLPVIVVPEKYEAKNTDNVVFASDIERINDWEILDPMLQFVKKRALTLQILTVREPLPDKEFKQFEKDKHEVLSEMLAGVKTEWHHAYKSNIEQAIIDFAKHSKAQAIVVIAHDRDWITKLFHHSVSESIVKKSGIPVWVLPDIYLEQNTTITGSGIGYF